jgi:outer membrane immunogenic protein
MRHLKSVLLAGVACAIALPAFAADLSRPVYKAPAPAPVAAYDWTGFYLGGNLGGKWGNFDTTITSGTGAVLGFSGSGDASFVGGGQLGFMWQTGQFVFGIEGDIDATRLGKDFTSVLGVGPFVVGDSLALRNDWQASARGRLGYAWDRTLIYVTGGGSWANLKATATFVPVGAIPGTILSGDRTAFGWTIGGGVDYGIAPGWSLGVEYRFTRYDSDNNGTALGSLITSAAGASTPLTFNRTLDTNEVTARVNYHFNWSGPAVAARY